MRERWKQWQIFFSWAPKLLQMVTAATKLRHLLLGRQAMTNLNSVLKSRAITLPTKVHLIKVTIFPSSHIRMWELDHKEGWAPKNWCFWTVVLEKTFESPLDCKEIRPVNPEGNQPLIFIGRTAAKAPVLWPPDMKSRLIEKDLDAGKDSRQKEKRATENEMVGWHHRLNGHEFEQAPGDGEGQGSLACCSPWGRKESDTALQLNKDIQARNPASQDCRDQTCVPINVVGQNMSFGAPTKLVGSNLDLASYQLSVTLSKLLHFPEPLFSPP